MKGKLCFGLLLLSFIMAGLSLNVCSDVNAYQFPIDNIDFSRDTLEIRRIYDNNTNSYVYGYFSRNHNFIVRILDSDIPSLFEYPHTWQFTGNFVSESDNHLFHNYCEVPDLISGNSNYYSDGVNYTNYSVSPSQSRYDLSFSLANDLSGFDLDYQSINPDDFPFDWSESLPNLSNAYPFHNGMYCHLQNYSYVERGGNNALVNLYAPQWNFASLVNIPLVNNRLNYSSSQPYTYAFNKLYLNGRREVNGMVQNRSGLKSSEIFKSPIQFTHLGMNFTLFNSPDYLFPEDDPQYSYLYDDIRKLSIGGSIVFDQDYALGSDSSIHLGIDNFYDAYFSTGIYDSSITVDGVNLYDLSDNSHFNHHVTKSCTITEYHVANGDSSNRIDFVCDYDPLVDGGAMTTELQPRFMNFTLSFDGSLNGDFTSNNFFTLSPDGSNMSIYPDYTFVDFYVITNGDSTPAPTGFTASSNGTGGDRENAPGMEGSGVYEDDPLASLQNLFNFGFFNPFAPLFNMFSDNNSCASIPTLAGMLHSNETQVCPFFNSNIRAIVTPVLSMASMMLVFGFAVRWLGSSSGNLFEDSRHEELSNQSGHWERRKK